MHTRTPTLEHRYVPGYKCVCMDGGASAESTINSVNSNCSPRACENNPDVDNAASFVGCENATSGSICVVKCADGYEVFDQDYAKCVDGEWISKPTCRQKICNNLPEIENAHYVNEENCNGAVDGDTCPYACETGFVLSDTNHRTIVNTSASTTCVLGEWVAGLKCVDLNECIFNADECTEIGDVNDRSMCSPCFPYVVRILLSQIFTF